MDAKATHSSSRVMALDYGSGRCGVAVSDPTGTIATPLAAIHSVGARRGRRELLRLIDEQQVNTVVVGLPLGLSGQDTAQTTEAREFAQRLRESLMESVSIELYDERFTTRMAQATAGKDSEEDSRAAAILLENWLRSKQPSSSA